jgi:hypothetical protein
MSIPVVGPLEASEPVGGGEDHDRDPVHCVEREVFSSKEVFSVTTSRGISITTSR